LISASTLAAALLEVEAEGDGCGGADEDRVALGVAAGWRLAPAFAVRCRDGVGRGVVAAELAGAGRPAPVVQAAPAAQVADPAGPAAASVLARLAPPVARRTATTAPIRIATVTARIR
jgi:hypothetical protein